VILAGVTVFGVLTWYAHYDADSTHLQDQQYKVTVRSADGGYVLEYGVTNSPYATREGVATDLPSVCRGVQQYLKEPLVTKWGK
jgi:hypothetical protein